MKALILAAGRGSRLGNLTIDRPKCMVALAGRSLLQWQCDALRTAGFDDIHVMAGYRSDRIDVAGISVEHYPEWDKTNMVGTLWHARRHLSTSTTLVAYSDIVYHPNIPHALLECDADIAISYDSRWDALWRLRNPADPLADAECFLQVNGSLRHIGGHAKTWDDARGQYMGLLRFTPTGWVTVQAYLQGIGPEGRARLDMTSLLGALLLRGTTIAAIGVEGRWCEVDCPSDIALYESQLGGADWSHDWRWSRSL